MRYEQVSTRHHLTVNWDVVWSLSKPPSCSITPFEELHFIHHWRMLEKWQLSCFVAALLRNKKVFCRLFREPKHCDTATVKHNEKQSVRRQLKGKKKKEKDPSWSFKCNQTLYEDMERRQDLLQSNNKLHRRKWHRCTETIQLAVGLSQYQIIMTRSWPEEFTIKNIIA